jgi:hypothetical protein
MTDREFFEGQRKTPPRPLLLWRGSGPVERGYCQGPLRQRLPGSRVPARLRCERVCMGCGASLHHSRSAAIVDDSRALRRALHSVPSDGVSLAPKTRTPPVHPNGAGSREPSVECIEIISCYEGSACETCRRDRGSLREPARGAPPLYSLRSNSFVRTNDAINGVTLKQLRTSIL